MSSIKIHLRGSLSPYVSVNDIANHIMGLLGTESARDKTAEFTGPGLSSLSEGDSLIISSMLTDIGVPETIFPIDEIGKKGSKGKKAAESVDTASEGETTYDAIYDVNLSDSEPNVASQNSVYDIGGVEASINAAIIGGLNGRISDIKAAYEIIKDRHVSVEIDAVLIPSSPEVYKEAIKKGYIEEFIDAGFRIFPPGYIPEIIGEEGCISCMGHFSSPGFSASPQVIASSAITGKVSDQRIVDSKAERKAEKKTEKKTEKAEKLAMKAEKAAAKAEDAAKKINN